MAIERSIRCSWEGCMTAALIGCPEGYEFCEYHIDQATQNVQQLTEHLNESTKTVWQKPGRWVPVVLFVLWLAATAIYPTMILWWGIFVPIGADRSGTSGWALTSPPSSSVGEVACNLPHLYHEHLNNP